MELQVQLLGIIAVATAVMAAVQLGLVIQGIRAAKRINRLIAIVEEELRPALGHVDRISADGARMTSLAAAQAERVDRIIGRFTKGADHVTVAAREAVVLRHGGALLAGLRAALAAFLDPPPAPTPVDAEPADRPERRDPETTAAAGPR